VIGKIYELIDEPIEETTEADVEYAFRKLKETFEDGDIDYKWFWSVTMDKSATTFHLRTNTGITAEDEQTMMSKPLSRPQLQAILSNHLDEPTAKIVIKACLQHSLAFHHVTLDTFQQCYSKFNKLASR